MRFVVHSAHSLCLLYSRSNGHLAEAGKSEPLPEQANSVASVAVQAAELAAATRRRQQAGLRGHSLGDRQVGQLGSVLRR